MKSIAIAAAFVLCLPPKAFAFSPAKGSVLQSPTVLSVSSSPHLILQKPSLDNANTRRQWWRLRRTNTSSRKFTASRTMKAIAAAAKREAKLTYRVAESNILSTQILGMACTAAFCMAQGLGPRRFAASIAKSFLWFCFYGYHFDLANQIEGVEEDAMNDLPTKRNRPMASGDMSVKGGVVRYVLTGAAWLAISTRIGALAPCVSWIVTTFLLNKAGWSNLFATKNYYGMSAGSAAMLLAARSFAGDFSSSIFPPLIAASYIGSIMDIQDFRDESGDRTVGRKTTAVLLGVKKARKVWGVQMVAMTAVAAKLLANRLTLLDSLIGAGGVALLIGTLRGNSVQDDDKSYKNLVLYGFLIYMRSAFWAQPF